MTACSTSPAGTATTVPTLTLVPATATHTPIPPTPTQTAPPPLLPQDLITDIPENLATLTIPEEQRIAQQVLDALAQSTNLPSGAFRLAFVESVVWGTGTSSCEGDLSGSGYRLLTTAGSTVYEHHTDATETIIACEPRDVTALAPETLLLVDPVADEMVALARQRLMTERNLRAGQIRVVDIEPETWEDNSLGCPAEGRSYSPLRSDGYRITLRAGESRYIFHTDFNRLMLCVVLEQAPPTAAASPTPLDTPIPLETPNATPEQSPDAALGIDS